MRNPPAAGRPEGAGEPPELQDLRQFFYQCPVGLFEISDDGAVRTVNPAAVAMLGPSLGGDDLSQLCPLLGRLAPETVDLIRGNRSRMAPLAAGRRILIPAGAHGELCLELRAVRVTRDRVMIVLQDVTEERRLAERKHEIAVELQLAMLGRIDEIPAMPVGVTYRAAELELDVGGDWYDVISLPRAAPGCSSATSSDEPGTDGCDARRRTAARRRLRAGRPSSRRRILRQPGRRCADPVTVSGPGPAR